MRNIKNRAIKHLKLGDDNTVYIRLSGSSNIIQAKALEVRHDQNGNITYLMLDRLIHKPSESEFESNIDGGFQPSFTVSGCYVSVLENSQAASLTAC